MGSSGREIDFSSRLYENELIVWTVNVGNFCASNLLCGSFSAERSVPPVIGLPPPEPVPGDDDDVLPAAGVLPFLLLLPQPTTAIAPAEAPPIAAICNARRRLIRCATMRSQYEVDWPIADPSLVTAYHLSPRFYYFTACYVAYVLRDVRLILRDNPNLAGVHLSTRCRCIIRDRYHKSAARSPVGSSVILALATPRA